MFDRRAFSKQAHVVPAGLGNRKLFTLEECDQCNEFLSSLENDLVNSFSLERVFGLIRPRRGSPRHQHPGSRSWLTADVRARSTYIRAASWEENIRVRRVGETAIEIEARCLPYSPMRAARGLACLALRAIPADRLSEWSHVVAWVRGDVLWQPQLAHGFAPLARLGTTELDIVEEPGVGLVVLLRVARRIQVLRLPRVPWEVLEVAVADELNVAWRIESIEVAGLAPPTTEVVTLCFRRGWEERFDGGEVSERRPLGSTGSAE